MDKLDHLGWVVSASFAIGDARFGDPIDLAGIRRMGHGRALGAYEVEDVEDFVYSVGR